jgi:hypothetical protein
MLQTKYPAYASDRLVHLQRGVRQHLNRPLEPVCKKIVVELARYVTVSLR